MFVQNKRTLEIYKGVPISAQEDKILRIPISWKFYLFEMMTQILPLWNDDTEFCGSWILFPSSIQNRLRVSFLKGNLPFFLSPEKASHCSLCWELFCLLFLMLPIALQPQGTINVLMWAKNNFKLSLLNKSPI